LCNFLHSPVTSSFLGSNILLSTLFSNTLSLCSSLNVRDQVLALNTSLLKVNVRVSHNHCGMTMYKEHGNNASCILNHWHKIEESGQHHALAIFRPRQKALIRAHQSSQAYYPLMCAYSPETSLPL
jgi:hypothetical protein